jgi:hypothetical protein
MRPSLALVMALIVTSSLAKETARPARAGESDWAALTRRLAASHPFGPRNVALGGEPPGFAWSSSWRPALPVLGSTWLVVVRGGPEAVRVYYAATPRTTAAVDVLVAKLASAGYVHIPESGFTDAFVGEYGPVHIWCPAQRKGSTVEMNVENVDGVPALDIQFHRNSPKCNEVLDRRTAGSPVPALGAIPGLTIYPRTRSTEAGGASLGSVAVIRTTLPAADAVAKLAERFTAKGWIARSRVVDGTTILQHFARTDASRRWDALLMFVPRPGSDQEFDALLDVRRAPLAAAER